MTDSLSKFLLIFQIMSFNCLMQMEHGQSETVSIKAKVVCIEGVDLLY